ncbi:hypothetical protein [uncultured Ruegeria sp.]|uniref:hypothetical protein n=1 Tax=uncultured Ruegeria sp. TaxID=259304 RepID=UPI00262EAC8B|nr:hypothetical protein [uncultured Ruegeria sp.]
MTSTSDLMNHKRLAFVPQTDGSTEVRFDMNGFGDDIVCRYWPVAGPNRDPWSYELETIQGKGGTYSHPSEHGCKIAIVKHLVDAGLIGAVHDNSHLDDRNQVIAADLKAARETFTGKPTVGDFVVMPDGSVERCCQDAVHGMQTTDGGSFFVHASGKGSFSGALNRPQLWEYFQDAGETRLGKFWFFSHNYAGPGRRVDVFLPCRVFQLVPFTMTEEQARVHPKAQATAEVWGENHSDHLRVISRLMAGQPYC